MTKSRSSTFRTSGSSPTGKSVSPAASTPACDFRLENHGSIFLLKPLNTVSYFLARRPCGPGQRLSTVLANVRHRASLRLGHRCGHSERWIGGAMKSKKKLTASDLRRQAEAMVAAGTMPSLKTVLEAVAEVRAKYVPLIKAARLRARRED